MCIGKPSIYESYITQLPSDTWHSASFGVLALTPELYFHTKAPEQLHSCNLFTLIEKTVTYY